MDHPTETIGRRITRLREHADLTLEELASRIGVNATTLGRIEKGQTQKIGSDVLVALARIFHVSVDFLLGLTDLPDQKNYGIDELGLSAQAVRNLAARRVHVDVVNQLLEHPRFALLTARIAQYLDDTFAAAVAAQDQLFDSMSELLLRVGPNVPEQQAAAKEAARAVHLSKVPPYQVDLTKIQNTFLLLLKEMKQEAGENLEPAKTATKAIVDKLLDELTPGQDAPLTTITLDQITDAILHTVDGAGLPPEKLAAFRGGLRALLEPNQPGQKV